VIDCNEWKTEKRHECTNMGKVKRLELWWQLYRASLPERDVRNITPMDFCWTECTCRSPRYASNTNLTGARHNLCVLTKNWTFWELKPDLPSGTHDLFTAVPHPFTYRNIFRAFFTIHLSKCISILKVAGFTLNVFDLRMNHSSAEK